MGVGVGPEPQPLDLKLGGWPTLCCQVPAHLRVLYRTWVLCAVLTSNAWRSELEFVLNLTPGVWFLRRM